MGGDRAAFGVWGRFDVGAFPSAVNEQVKSSAVGREFGVGCEICDQLGGPGEHVRKIRRGGSGERERPVGEYGVKLDAGEAVAEGEADSVIRRGSFEAALVGGFHGVE